MPLTELSFLGLVATALITALLISFVATPVVKSLAQKVGAVDVPKDGRRMHDHPIPRMGGLAIFLGFMLAVLLVARLTDGFLFSLVATVVSVIGVNYAFTYPYFAFNFTITGYPLTFVTMFAVSIVVGMLTDQVKRQERVKSEAEKEKMKALLEEQQLQQGRKSKNVGTAETIIPENIDPLEDPLCLLYTSDAADEL